MQIFWNIDITNHNYNGSELNIVTKYQSHLTLVDILKDIKVGSCPHCNSKSFIKYGKYKGIQRFRCTNEKCKKTFSSKTNTLFYNSKKPINLWLKYVILMSNGKSLRECAAILKINLATAFFWRHKILITQLENNNKRLENYVEVSKIIMKENFKGNRSAKHNRKDNIFIACGMDSNNTIISKPISRYTISLPAINKNFAHNISEHSIISAYNDRYFAAYAKKHNSSSLPLSKTSILNLVQQVISNKITTDSPEELITINEHLPRNSIFIHSFSLNIKRWLIRFRGVATKYLENYLNWHILDYRNNYQTYLINQINLFKDNYLKTNYIKIKDFPRYEITY
ncbi:MAG: IS1 family transposase [Clostridium sp.]|uniref:IS1/IS1595 family N-terminal zinc-binding domain-containing protein n=1 Tax=Clostridium sp. TaxID=1506 RepID=UPI0025B84502|nr:hypothetical protein [Clostridium sp.]MCF0147179.1 IS1 family transposase [Clostridium sp.]